MPQGNPAGYLPADLLALMLGESNPGVQGMRQYQGMVAPFAGMSRVGMQDARNLAQEQGAQGDQGAMGDAAVLEHLLGLRGPVPQMSSQLPPVQPDGYVPPAPSFGGFNPMTKIEQEMQLDAAAEARRQQLERQRMGR